MVKATAGLLRRLLGLVTLIAVAYAGWKWGDAVFPDLEARLGLGPPAGALVVEDGQASESLGRSTLERLESFRAGRGAAIELSGPELTSLLRHARPDLLPQGMHAPLVRLWEGRAEVSAEVAVRDFPSLPDLGPMAGMLPDTVSLRVEGSVMGFGEGMAALVAQRVEVAGVPLPRPLIPEVLEALGRKDRAGLPADAAAVALPEGIASAHVSGDRLVLVADR